MRNRFILTALVLTSSLTSAQSRGRDDRLKLALKPAFFELDWQYKNFPLKVRVFEVGGDESQLYKMGNISSLKELDFKQEVTGKPIRVGGENVKMLALVVENQTKSEIRFAASPHTVNPVSDSFGFKFKCLCFGHTYSVKPGSVWYRIVKLEANATQAGRKVKVSHSVFSVDDEASQPETMSSPK